MQNTTIIQLLRESFRHYVRFPSFVPFAGTTCSFEHYCELIPKQCYVFLVDIDVEKDFVSCPIPYGGMLLLNNLIPHRRYVEYITVIFIVIQEEFPWMDANVSIYRTPYDKFYSHGTSSYLRWWIKRHLWFKVPCILLSEPYAIVHGCQFCFNFSCRIKNQLVLPVIANHEQLLIHGFFYSLPNISKQVRWSLDLRWQNPNLPCGFYDLKHPVLMRTAKDPHMKVDWSGFTTVDRHDKQREAVKDMLPVGLFMSLINSMVGCWGLLDALSLFQAYSIGGVL